MSATGDNTFTTKKETTASLYFQSGSSKKLSLKARFHPTVYLPLSVLVKVPLQGQDSVSSQ